MCRWFYFKQAILSEQMLDPFLRRKPGISVQLLRSSSRLIMSKIFHVIFATKMMMISAIVAKYSPLLAK